MKTKKMILILFFALLLTACSQSELPNSEKAETVTVKKNIEMVPAVTLETIMTVEISPINTPFKETNYPEAVLAARADLSTRLSKSINEIIIIKVSSVEWPDACLGVEKPGIMCAQMVTPGYLIILSIDNKNFEYHTDLGGKSLKFIK